MARLYLARHGQDEDNANGLLNGHRDTPLTANGLSQAHELARHLKESGIGFDKIYASPLQRAHKTAEIAAQALGILAPEKLDLLIERDFGTMSGKKVTEIEALCAPNIVKTATITYFLSPENAETFPDLLERAGYLLAALEKRHGDKDENILLVSHGDLGKMVYAAFYGHEWLDILMKFHFGNSELLLLDANSDPSERHVFKQKQFNH